jgi:hypothetical protein
MKDPNPIIVFGAVFLLGLVALLVYSYSIAHSITPLDISWVGLVLMSVIPEGLILSVLSLRGGQPNIPLGFVSLIQVSIIVAGIYPVHFWLRRFSPGIAFLGLTITYVAFCYGTNRLFLSTFFHFAYTRG